ncbi:hypothetical protein ACFWDA_15975 [Rhodococcus zopfii]|uniref:hypothetical protein n=1 Tax=Rhodococcus zopfii TaxID=43772 RepID=UPI003658E1D1
MSTAENFVARVRGGFAGATSGAVSIAAHALGGGGTPTQSAVALLIATTLAVGVVAAGTRLPLAGVLVAGQVLGHLVLSFDAGHAHIPGPAMIAGHAAATAVAALLVAAAERGCRIAIAALRRVAPKPFTPLPVPVAAPAPSFRPPVLRGLLRSAGIVPRGPPVTV